MRSIFIVLFLSFFPIAHTSFALTMEEIETQKEKLNSKVKEFDITYNALREMGKLRATRFSNSYFSGFYANRGADYDLSMIISSYESGGIEPVLNFESSRKFYLRYLDFINIKNFDVFTYDTPPKTELYKAIFEYGIGLLFNLKSLSERDLVHRDELLSMRALVGSRLIRFLEVGGKGQESLSSIEYIYFPIAIGYHLDFPADVMKTAAQRASAYTSIDKDKGLSVGAATLLAELTMLCNSRCTQPSLVGQFYSLHSLDTYKKEIFWTCKTYCSKSYLGLVAAGFYRDYLSLLAGTNDPHYSQIRDDLLLIFLKGYASNFEGILDMEGGGSFRYWIIFKMLVENFWKLFRAFLAYCVFAPSLWLILLSSGLILVVAFGPRKFLLKESTSFSSASPWKLPFIFLYKRSILIFELFKELLIVLFLNTTNSFSSNNTFQRLGSNLIVAGVAFFLADIKSLIDYY